MKRERRNHSANVNAKVALAAIGETRRWQSYPSSLMCIRTRFRAGGVSDWTKLLDKADQMFDRGGSSPFGAEYKGQGSAYQDRTIDDGTGLLKALSGVWRKLPIRLASYLGPRISSRLY